MTGWKIELGYNGQSGKTNDELWETLVESAKDLKSNLDCFDAGFVKNAELNTQENLTAYLSHIIINDEEESQYIMVLASGGNPYRDWKEDVARLYVLKLMENTMRQRINISVSVA